MIHTLQLLFLFITTGSTTENRPDLQVSRIPTELLANAYSVIRYSEVTYDIKSTKVYVEHVKQAVTIFDKRTDYDVLRVYYDQYSKAKILWANIYDSQGALIRKVKKDEIQDIALFDGFSIYTDVRFLGLELLGGRLPYTIEYTYEVENKATASYTTWLPQDFNVSIESATLSVKAPRNITIYARELNGPISHAETVEENIVTRTWTLKHRQAVPDEDLSPPSEEIFPVLLLSPDAFIIDDYSGSMSDWKSFGAFMEELNAGREVLSESMASKVRSLIAHVEDDKDRVNILYQYLKENMRYVSVQLGIGGWQSYDAKYVEANKYGDCKALSHFMKGMLTEAGITSYTVLVAAGKPTTFLDDFVTPGSFNHMMLHVPSMDLWLECTSKNAPTGYISYQTADRDVLLITPQGGIKSRTPADALSTSGVTTYDSIYLTTESWHMTGNRVYSGATHEYYRYLYSAMSTSEQEAQFREQADVSIKHIDSLSYNVDLHSPIATCTYALELAQYGSVSGNRVFLPINPLYRFESPCVTEKRLHDIYRQYPVVENNSTTIVIPEGYEIESLPATRTADDVRFGSYALQVSQKDNTLIIERSLTIPRMQLDAEVYSEMCAFNKMIETADRGSLVLRKVGP